ncbi:hypothetical protein SAMN05216344_106126 [Polaromonas sp. OV174]|uniref:hypothetical protein n=1 Tax=Polaromonas sp. OV174 TaxID=1855300 RepID=UPI0008F2918D|nr:hypothetical protein [Polaromonas sp. OV174]SFB96728.1 hypothetical protein SAMN05216344_106126 [Polaromonas sp. OV174]
MFNLAPTQTFKETVTVSVKQENGSWKEESFTAVFDRASEDDREELLALKHVELVRRKLVGWQMKDAQGQDVPFTPENLEGLLKLTGAVRETVMSFWRANTGSREKN